MSTDDDKDLPATHGNKPVLILLQGRKRPRSQPPHLHANQLERDIRLICTRNRQGAHRTQADRLDTLLLCARQLFALGVLRKRAVNLNDADVRKLVEGWHAQQLTAATIRNRLRFVRWLGRKIGKPNLVAASNNVYGAGRRPS